MALIIILTLIQAVFTATVYTYYPYSSKQLNLQLLLTQTLYLLLDLLFILLIGWGQTASERFRYYLIGFGMIIVVCLTLACNIGFSVYSTVCVLRERWKTYKESKSSLKAQETDARLNQSQEELQSSSIEQLRNH